MLDFIEKKFQKSIDKIKSKTFINEEDVLKLFGEIKLSLLEADVNFLVVKEFISSIKEKTFKKEIIGKLNQNQHLIDIIKKELVYILGQTTKDIDLKDSLPIIMMVGLQGSGKTTSSAKLAKFFMKKKNFKKPLIIAADVYRPAAIDQIVILGKQLNIDVYNEGVNVKPEIIVENGIKNAKLNNNDLIIIDTAGRLSIDDTLMNELIRIKKVSDPEEMFLIVDAFSGQDIINVAKTFNDKLSLSGLMITKLDSDARGGAALSITKMLNIPIVFTGSGEKMSAIDLFHPDRMADRILGMGDFLSLIEKTSEVIDEKSSQKMMNRMMHGNFDLDDLMEQFKQIAKIGKFSKILKMIPGVNNKISSLQADNLEDKMKLYSILLSSMTKFERKNPKLLKNASRKKRIIKGSGRTNQEYNKLMNDFERISKQMKNISKSIKDNSFNTSMLKGLKS